MLKNYLKTAWRNLGKQRITSLINISGLAIGMASAVLIFMWVHNELNYDNYHPESARVYRVKNYVAIDKTSTWIWENSPYPLSTEIQKQLPEVEVSTQVQPINYAPLFINMKGEFFPEKNCAYVDENWFKMFHYDFVQGDTSSFNRNIFSLILTESRAKKYFGAGNPIGKTLRIDTLDYTVQAIIKENPANSSFQFDMILPLAAKMANAQTLKNELSWGNFNYLTFLRLLPGAKPETVSKKIHDIYNKNRKENNVTPGLISLAEMHFESDLQSSTLVHGDKKMVYIFAVLAIILLLIACINYVNLTTARATLRIKEVSIKKIVGAGRRELLFQFIFESAMLSALAMLISLGIIKLALPFFNQVSEKHFVLSFGSLSLWSILFGTLVASVILTSIYPALLLSSFQPISIFRGVNMLKIKDVALRKGLVVIQFTVSIILIIGVIVVYRQLQFIRNTEYGFNRSQTLSFNVPYKVMAKYEADKRIGFLQGIKTSLLAQSSIENVSIMSQNSVIDMKGQSSGSAHWAGRQEGFDPSIAYFGVDNDFNKIVSLQMTAGRWFSEDATADNENYILNETAVKELGIQQPVIGQWFIRGQDTGQIIGVVKDFHYRSLHDKIGPAIMTKAKWYSSHLLIKTAPGRIPEALAATEKTWKTFLPNLPFTYNFLDDEFNNIYRADQKTSTLIALFAVIAVIISCLGLFGLAAFTAERRIKEVGIRKVLGASVPGIVRLLSKDFLLLVIIAFVIASPIAWWAMNKWLQDFAYHTSLSWWIFIGAGIISVLVALLTVIFQAIKAAVANPVKSLRTE